MRCLIVNPYGPAYGVTSYSRLANRLLSPRIPVELLENDEGLSFEGFREHVAEHVVRSYAPDEVVIEVPDARAAAATVPPDYRLHVRLHSAGALGEIGNGWPVDVTRLETEVALIRRATVVSSASHAIVDQMGNLIGPVDPHVFKNPADQTIPYVEPSMKDVDVCFMGRLERLKGSDWLPPLLERLPSTYRAVLFGPGVELFEPPPNVRCRIETRPAIRDRSRFDIVGRSRVFLMLSRFENCSVAVLEALAAGTAVVAWDVGGHAEIAPPPLIRLVPHGAVDEMTEAIVEAVEGPYPSRSAFQAVTDALVEDFHAGWAATWEHVRAGGSRAPFRGLSTRSAHIESDPRLRTGPALVKLADAYAEALARGRP